MGACVRDVVRECEWGHQIFLCFLGLYIVQCTIGGDQVALFWGMFQGSVFFTYLNILVREMYQMTSSTFFALTSPPFQRLVVAGGFGDVSALASTEVITVPLEFYRNYSQPVLSANIFLY